jgi:single-strand DNA-binding protein
MANPNVTIEGRLVGDPEFKSLPTGSLLKFRIITNDRVKTANGDWVDKDTSGWNVEVWSKLADATNGLLKKGMGVIVTGTLKVREYEKDGSKRYVTELRASNIAVDVYSMAKAQPKVDAGTYTGSDIWDTESVSVPF